VREDFVPIVKHAQGFIRYYWLDTGEGEAPRSVSLRIKPALTSRYTWLRTT